MRLPVCATRALGAAVSAALSAFGLAFAAAADPTSTTTAPSQPPAAPPNTEIVDTAVPGVANVSYQVVGSSTDVATADVKYTEDGNIVGFTPVALPWSKPVRVAPPLSIVTVYATIPKSTDPDAPTPEDASVTCKVLVNGAVVKQDTARGTNATATCAVSLNLSDPQPSAPTPAAPTAPSAPPTAPALPAPLATAQEPSAPAPPGR
jgi:hypothetical protein